MLFADMIRSIRRQARLFRMTFEKAKENQPAFARFDSIDSLIGALPLSTSLPLEERHAITMAMLKEHKSAKSPLWSSLLVIAFEPALRKLLGRIPSVPKDEREQVLLTAFLEVLRTAANAANCVNAPLYIKRATELAVVRPLRTKNQAAEFVEYEEDKTLGDPNDVFRDPIHAGIDLFEMLGDGPDSAVFDALQKTAVNDQSLKDVVAELHPGASAAERRRIWRKWLRARKETIARANAKAVKS